MWQTKVRLSICSITGVTWLITQAVGGNKIDHEHYELYETVKLELGGRLV